MQRTMTVPQAADEVSLAASSLARLRGDSPARWHHLERIIDLALDAPTEAREAVVHAHSAGVLALLPQQGIGQRAFARTRRAQHHHGLAQAEIGL